MRYADNNCTYVETFENRQHYYVFTGPCMITGKLYSVKIKGEELFKYRQGAFVQDAFPDMPAADREFLMSGYSPEGWEQIFGDGEEEERQAIEDGWLDSHQT